MTVEPGAGEEGAAATPRLYMVGNAHIDPVWLWRWTEGCAEAIGTCWAAVDLLERCPGVVFTRGDVMVYRWIKSWSRRCSSASAPSSARAAGSS